MGVAAVIADSVYLLVQGSGSAWLVVSVIHVAILVTWLAIVKPACVHDPGLAYADCLFEALEIL
jgi:hypothetical protein